MSHDNCYSDDPLSAENFYGDIGSLSLEPMKLDGAKMGELGLGPAGPAQGSAVMRYAAGCVRRERERLARIFIKHEAFRGIAAAILDSSMDDFVFKWNGPEVLLESPPKSSMDREADSIYKPENL